MRSTTAVDPGRKMRALESALLGTRFKEIHLLVPGLLLAALLAWLSVWLSEYIGCNVMGFEKSPVSSVTMAILLGLIIGNIVALPDWLRPGFRFAVRKVLRLGIIMLGIRLSLFDVFRLGAVGVPIVLVCILGALFFCTRLSAWLRLPARLGTLIAVGTSICGVSAIVATGPAIDAREEEVAYAVSVITIFGMVATLVYPYVAHLIFADDAVKAGLFLGTAIHDTSQVTGAALIFSDIFSLPRGLDVATVTKLVRNVFMAAVIPFMAFRHARKMAVQDRAGRKAELASLLPLFVIGFLCLALLRSVGDVGVHAGGRAFGVWGDAAWKDIYSFAAHWAVNLMVVALSGVGLSTRLRILKGLGGRPFVVGFGAALIVGAVSFAAISLLGAFVTL
jgi:uncharacterized integral membrane protein (TIGR00698 family)